jgi:hypothetical protein
MLAPEATGNLAGGHANPLGEDDMRALRPVVACGLVLGMVAGCQKPAKVTQQEAAIAEQATEQTSASAAAVAESRYRSYRWMTDEEMVRYRLGYDPTMSFGTRDAVEQAVDDDLADKGFRRSEPADFVVAFSDVYIDRNRSAPGWAFEGPAIEATGGVGGSQVEAYDDMEIYRTPEEAFTIVFLDARTRRLLWRGTGREHFGSESGEQSDAAIEAAVYHALADMPLPLAP